MVFSWFWCCFRSRNKEEKEEKEEKGEKEQQPIPTYENTVPFVPPFKTGYVIKVYDGDTITIACQLPQTSSPMYRMSVRLNGIDCPEMKTTDANEKQCAQLAKDEMTRLVLGKHVQLKNTKLEKYGRLLADVYVGSLHVNQHMLDKRLAVPYDGNTKQKIGNWMAFHFSDAQIYPQKKNDKKNDKTTQNNKTQNNKIIKQQNNKTKNNKQ